MPVSIELLNKTYADLFGPKGCFCQKQPVAVPLDVSVAWDPALPGKDTSVLYIIDTSKIAFDHGGAIKILSSYPRAKLVERLAGPQPQIVHFSEVGADGIDMPRALREFAKHLYVKPITIPASEMMAGLGVTSMSDKDQLFQLGWRNKYGNLDDTFATKHTRDFREMYRRLLGLGATPGKPLGIYGDKYPRAFGGMKGFTPYTASTPGRALGAYPGPLRSAVRS